jgi:hypothetical protein
MDSPVVSLPTFDSLRRFAHDMLCSRDRLDPGQAALRQAVIQRSGRTCGLFFQVVGPQRQKAYGIWAGDEHRLLFYDAVGIRFAEATLSEAPDPAELDRQAA